MRPWERNTANLEAALRFYGHLEHLGGLALITSPTLSRADEQYFGYTYPAEGMQKGALELYQWNTLREGRTGKPSPALNFATEIEYGIAEDWALSFYIDYGFFEDVDFVFQGLRTSVKHFFLTPVRDGFGLGLYFLEDAPRVEKLPPPQPRGCARARRR